MVRERHDRSTTDDLSVFGLATPGHAYESTLGGWLKGPHATLRTSAEPREFCEGDGMGRCREFIILARSKGGCWTLSGIDQQYSPRLHQRLALTLQPSRDEMPEQRLSPSGTDSRFNH